MFNRMEILAIKSMYILQNMTAGQIAAQVGKTPPQIGGLIAAEGWGPMRRKINDTAARTEEERATVIKAGFLQAVGVQSEELAERGMEMARTAANTGDTKGYMYAASGTKTFVGMARVAMGLEDERQAHNASLSFILATPLPIGTPRPSLESPREDTIEIDAAPSEAETLEFA